VLCNEPAPCARVHERIARGYGELGAWGFAHRHFAAAANEAPSVERWLESADAAARAGSPTLVHFALDRARREGELSVEQRRRLVGIEETLAGSSPR